MPQKRRLFRRFYTFFTACNAIFSSSFYPPSYTAAIKNRHLWRCPVSISVIAGTLLVLLLLGYLVYALFNAEEF
ncbi:K(+)-transporting ATPase subunit F [Serratia sp. MYb239]|nr:K(+)-transporting ATPase subunit F [Serratia sp. MYb239]CAE1143572.1 K(+)-transporting ATPase subunit F [Serratia sp. Tan611]